MNAQPLPQHLYEKAIELGIKEIQLQWSGGSDNGYLEINTEPYGSSNSGFNQELEDWAWDAYSYSGAGDGSEYGDNITYDLHLREVRTEEWFMVRETHDGPTEELELQTPEGETQKLAPQKLAPKKKTPTSPGPQTPLNDPSP